MGHEKEKYCVQDLFFIIIFPQKFRNIWLGQGHGYRLELWKYLAALFFSVKNGGKRKTPSLVMFVSVWSIPLHWFPISFPARTPEVVALAWESTVSEVRSRKNGGGEEDVMGI
jgi:hypothetical protein